MEDRPGNLTLTNATFEYHKPYDVTEETWIRVTIIPIYVVIFITGVTGNFLVIYVVLCRRGMRTTTNLFILNLACSDLILCLLAGPITPASVFTQSWIFGEVLCRLAPMALSLSVFVSSFTCAAIAVNRYLSLIYFATFLIKCIYD